MTSPVLKPRHLEALAVLAASTGRVHRIGHFPRGIGCRTLDTLALNGFIAEEALPDKPHEKGWRITAMGLRQASENVAKAAGTRQLGQASR